MCGEIRTLFCVDALPGMKAGRKPFITGGGAAILFGIGTSVVPVTSIGFTPTLELVACTEENPLCKWCIGGAGPSLLLTPKPPIADADVTVVVIGAGIIEIGATEDCTPLPCVGGKFFP